jgi:acetate kinase
LEAEETGDYRAGLAVRMYIYKIQQAIAAMTASMGNVDALVFTGTIGDRSYIIRKRVVEKLDFLGLAVQESINKRVFEPSKIIRISPRKRLRPIYVITTDEMHEIARRAFMTIGLH